MEWFFDIEKTARSPKADMRERIKSCNDLAKEIYRETERKNNESHSETNDSIHKLSELKSDIIYNQFQTFADIVKELREVKFDYNFDCEPTLRTVGDAIPYLAAEDIETLADTAFNFKFDSPEEIAMSVVLALFLPVTLPIAIMQYAFVNDDSVREAELNCERAKDYREESIQARRIHKKIKEGCDRLYTLLSALKDGWFNPGLSEVYEIIRDMKIHGRNKLSPDENKTLSSMFALAKMISTIIHTEIVDVNAGEFTDEYRDTCNKARRLIYALESK